MITIDKTYNDKIILSKKGEVIKVQLAENPTTGYLWEIEDLNSKHIHLKENIYEISDNAIGAGGVKVFYLEIIDKGLSELKIRLCNPWEHDTVDTFKIMIES